MPGGQFWPFSKTCHFSNICYFLELFFAQNNSGVIVEWFFACFREFSFSPQSDHFAKAIAFAWWPILAILPNFQTLSFFEYLLFLEPFFAENNSGVIVEWFFACFREFSFSTQSDHFAKAIGFA